MSEVVPAAVQMQVGNAEITNLIVQDQLNKLQQERAGVVTKLRDLGEGLEALEAEFAERINTIARDRWADKIKQLVLLLHDFQYIPELGVDDPEGDYDQYELTFTYDQRSALLLMRAHPDHGWTEHDLDNPPDEINVGFSLRMEKTKNGSTWARSIHPSSHEHVPVILDDHCREIISEARARNIEFRAMVAERDRIDKIIGDTANIEKKVLAELTRRTLSTNPDMMEHVRAIVANVEGDTPLIEAK